MLRALLVATVLSLAAPAAQADASSCIEGDGFYYLRVCYEGPTDRYGHGALGERGEWESVNIAFFPLAHTGVPANLIRQISFDAPSGGVFEGVTPDIADLDGDGIPEVIVTEATPKRGARILVFGMYLPTDFLKAPDRDPQPLMTMDVIASTRPIGHRFRWLAPIGYADFDGDGQNDIAYVETPHIRGVLRIVTLREGQLVEIAAAEGFSNHRFGAFEIVGGVRDCGDGPELYLPDIAWTSLMRVVFAEDGLLMAPIGPWNGSASIAAAANCSDRG